jgi:predicted RNase H-like HicB family nuclease
VSEITFNIECGGEGGYVARALDHHIFTEGETLEELKENIVQAVKCHFEPKELPQAVRLHFAADEILAI